MDEISSGKQRDHPADCEIGDWTLASSRREWDPIRTYIRYLGLEANSPVMNFSLQPTVEGRRISIWRRTS